MRTNLKCFVFLSFLTLSLNSFLFSTQENVKLSENLFEIVMSNEADMPSPSVVTQNPLKGFTAFVVVPGFPADSKKVDNRIRKQIENELKKYGKVIVSEVFTTTDQGATADLSVFDKGTLLSFRIQNILAADGKELDVARASMNLRAQVTIEKTSEEYSGYIWSRNCFLPGNVRKDPESLVPQGMAKLIKTFMNNYRAMNAETPTFYVVYP